MDIRNCRRCDRIYQHRGSKYCPNCMLELDEIFVKVRDYIYDNPNATGSGSIRSPGCGGEHNPGILKGGQAGAVIPGLDYLCERCEKPITTGRYCNDCIQELDRGMREGLEAPGGNPRGLGKDSKRMHTADFRRRRGIR
jgi:predicted amidophosphoribosyltransferase